MKDTTFLHQSEYEERIMRETVVRFLDGLNTMSLASSRDGSVYAASLFYTSYGLTPYFLSYHGRAEGLCCYFSEMEKLKFRVPGPFTPFTRDMP